MRRTTGPPRPRGQCGLQRLERIMQWIAEVPMVRSGTILLLVGAMLACRREADLKSVAFGTSVGAEVVRELKPGEVESVHLVLRTPMPAEWRIRRPKYSLQITNPMRQCAPQLELIASSPSGERFRVVSVASPDTCGGYLERADGSLRYAMLAEPREPCELRFQVFGPHGELLATESLPITLNTCGFCWEIVG